MKENRNDKLSVYIAIGLSFGALFGTTLALLGGLAWHNTFIQVSGIGFGICFGMLIGILIYIIRHSRP